LFVLIHFKYNLYIFTVTKNYRPKYEKKLNYKNKKNDLTEKVNKLSIKKIKQFNQKHQWHIFLESEPLPLPSKPLPHIPLPKIDFPIFMYVYFLSIFIHLYLFTSTLI
jgi:hypothetical protein